MCNDIATHVHIVAFTCVSRSAKWACFLLLDRLADSRLDTILQFEAINLVLSYLPKYKRLYNVLGVPSHSLHVQRVCTLLAWTTLDIKQRVAVRI